MNARHFPRQRIAQGLLVTLFVALSASVVHADDDDHFSWPSLGTPVSYSSARQQMSAPQMLKEYKSECSACHMAYPPGFLPKTAWSHIMGGLDKHFGSDASLDAPTVKRISDWLQAEGGTYRRASAAPSSNRISESAWFIRTHREVASSTWARASIKSRSNCVACHVQAEKGNFDEDAVRIPR